MKDIYSPLEIDEEWDNFAPVDTAVAPAPAAPGAQIMPEIAGESAPSASVNVPVGTAEPEAPVGASDGTPPPEEPPTNNLDAMEVNTNDLTPSGTTGVSIKVDGETNELPAENNLDTEVLATAAPEHREAGEADANTSATGSLDMDTANNDPARDAAIKAMGGGETLNKDEIIAKWGGENTADTKPDTLEVSDIGGTTAANDQAAETPEAEVGADDPAGVKVEVASDDVPGSDETANSEPQDGAEDTKPEQAATTNNDSIAGAVENLLRAFEDQIGQLENGLEEANKQKADLDKKVQENANNIEEMQKQLSDLKLKYDKAKDMAPNGQM